MADFDDFFLIYQNFTGKNFGPVKEVFGKVRGEDRSHFRGPLKNSRKGTGKCLLKQYLDNDLADFDDFFFKFIRILLGRTLARIRRCLEKCGGRRRGEMVKMTTFKYLKDGRCNSDKI